MLRCVGVGTSVYTVSNQAVRWTCGTCGEVVTVTADTLLPVVIDSPAIALLSAALQALHYEFGPCLTDVNVPL